MTEDARKPALSAAEGVAEFIELGSPEQKIQVACARISRCYARGQTVAVYAPDAGEAAELDGALWTFRQQSFIPHTRIEEAGDPLIEPVVIFSGEPGDLESDVLFVASAQGWPEWFGRYEHIYDFAPLYDEGLKQAARERFAACQAAGYHMRFIRS